MQRILHDYYDGEGGDIFNCIIEQIRRDTQYFNPNSYFGTLMQRVQICLCGAHQHHEANRKLTIESVIGP